MKSMKKKISIILLMALTFLMLIPFSAFAYAGGILNGKTMNIGTSVGVINSTTTLVTDDNTTTSISLPTGNYVWYEFAGTYNLTGFRIKSSSNTNTMLSVFNEVGDRIYYVQVQGDGTSTISITVPGAKRVSISNGGSQISLYEFDVYGTQAADTTAPAVPSGFAAVAGNGLVDLSWLANSESDLSNYLIYMDGVLKATLGKVTSYQVTGLTNGQSYSFQIASKDITGNESTKSTSISSTPIAGPDTTAPAAPTGLSATTGDTTAAISWTSSSEPDLAGYNLYRDGIKVNSSLITTMNYNDTGLTNGTQYSYTLTAVDTSANESTQSTAATVTPTTAPQPPAAPTGLTKTILNESIKLDWNAVSGADSYIVYRDGVQVGTPTGTTFTDTGLINHQNYTYTVSAVNAQGEGAQSAPIVASPADAIVFDGTVLPFNVPDMLLSAVSFLGVYGQWILLALAIIFSPVLYGLAMKLVHRAKVGSLVASQVDRRAGYDKLNKAEKKIYREKYGDPHKEKDKEIRGREWEKIKQAELRDQKDPVLSARRDVAREELNKPVVRSDRDGRSSRSGRPGRVV